ncbi:MAG TPA: 5'-nucleotidase [bacterium]|nr:5'-nucleotidase [bacterium]
MTLAVSSQSLFLAGWNGQGGVQGWRDHQRAHEDVPMAPGPAFPFVSRLLALNEASPIPGNPVHVHIVSRQEPSVSVRFLNSLEAHGLRKHYGKGFEQGVYLNGSSPLGALEVNRPHLFLSTRFREVRRALARGVAAAHLQPFVPPGGTLSGEKGRLTVALDGDAVVFGDESEAVYLRGGLMAFEEEEMRHAHEPLSRGPLYGFLIALGNLRAVFREASESPLHLHLVTARGFAGQKRAQRTLRGWAVPFDQTIFLSGAEKGPHLRRSGATIFFDDSLGNVRSAHQNGVPAAHVPFGVKNDPKAGRKKP